MRDAGSPGFEQRRALDRHRSGPIPRDSRGVAIVALLLALVLLGADCNKLIPAIGGSSTITLVTNVASGSPAQNALRAALERDIVLVRSEPAFEIESLQGAQLARVRHARNLALMVDLSRRDDFTREVEDMIGERLLADLRAGRRFYTLYSDVWADGQTLLVLAAPTAADLARAIETNADELYEAVERRVVLQTAVILYATGEQEDMARYLAATFGWTIRIPKGYRVSEDPDQQVVRFWMPEGGTRLVFVHWRDDLERMPSAEECIDLREQIAYRYDEDRVVRDRTTSSWEVFRGSRALKLDGVWQNDRYTKGGPFRTYCFMDRSRFYMIDLVVFDPEGSKMELMRQVEAFASTFRDVRD